MTAAELSLQKHFSFLDAMAKSLPGADILVLNKQLNIEFCSCDNFYLKVISSAPTTLPTLDQLLSRYSITEASKLRSAYQAALRGEVSATDITVDENWEHHSITPVFDDHGHVVHLLCLVENVTEQRSSLRSLQESEAHLKVATQLAKIGYWELDIDSLMFTFNEQFLQILKTSKEKLGGYQISAQRYAEEFVYQEDMHMIIAETQLAIDTDDPNFSRYVEHRFINGDGEFGYLGVRYTVVKDDHGRTIKTVGANQDITERKRAEEKLKKLLHQSTDQNRRLKDFSFMTSHNIRSSVANLVGLSQMLKDDPGNLDYINMLESTVSDLDKTIGNINALLNFENLLNAQALEDYNVVTAIERFKRLNAKWIEQCSVEIETKVPDSLCVNCAPAYVDSVIHNLLSNAMKYGLSDTAKRIEIGALKSQTPGIYVKDFGQGIDLEKYGKKLFELGRRFHTDGEGQGLGLYMIKHQIESNGGQISVSSSPGQGATFTVIFGGGN